MTVQHIYSRVKKIFPDVSLAEVVSLINEAFDDADDVLVDDDKRKKMNVVSGQYEYALGNDVITVKRVYYLNKDGDYKPIPLLIGDIDIGF